MSARSRNPLRCATRATPDGMVSHPDVFPNRGKRRLCGQFCRRLAKRRAACIFRLRVNEMLGATRVGCVMGNPMYCGTRLGTGVRSVQRRHHAPGWGALVCDRQGLEHVRLSTGMDMSKMRWRTRGPFSGWPTALSLQARVGPLLVYTVGQRLRGTSNLARVFMHGFFFRGPKLPSGPSERLRAAAPGWTRRLLASASAVMVVLDGRLDGMVIVLPALFGLID